MGILLRSASGETCRYSLSTSNLNSGNFPPMKLCQVKYRSGHLKSRPGWLLRRKKPRIEHLAVIASPSTDGTN